MTKRLPERRADPCEYLTTNFQRKSQFSDNLTAQNRKYNKYSNSFSFEVHGDTGAPGRPKGLERAGPKRNVGLFPADSASAVCVRTSGGIAMGADQRVSEAVLKEEYENHFRLLWWKMKK